MPFVLGSTQDEIANAIVAALRGPQAVAAGLQLEAKNVGGGRVHLGAPEGYTLNTEPSNLGQPATILSLAVPAVAGNPNAADVFDTQTFTVTYTPAAGPATTIRFEFDTDVIPNVTPGNIAGRDSGRSGPAHAGFRGGSDRHGPVGNAAGRVAAGAAACRRRLDPHPSR